MMAATLLGYSGFTALAQRADDLSPLPQWDRVISLQAGAGYKDNTTLSHAAPEASPFLKLEGEVMVFNLDPDGPQFSLFVSGDHRHYFSSPSVDNEDLVFGQAQIKVPVHDHGEASLAAEYVYQNQVLDVSVTEDIRDPVLVVGHTLTSRPGLRLNLLGRSWLLLEVPVARQYFIEPLDDYWEVVPRVELGWDYGRKSSVSLAYDAAWRGYDDLAALDASGNGISDSSRRFLQQDVRGTWRHYWDADRRWRTSARIGFKANRDNGGGYFDYHRVLGSGEVRYRTDHWDIKASALAMYYAYPIQTVSDTDPRKRDRTELHLIVGGERKLTRRLKLTAAYDYEQVWSNQTLDAYTVNTFTGGLSWEF